MPLLRKSRPKPRKRPKQNRSRETVDVILEAAARVFVAHGFARSSTNKIAKAAGVSVGSLYQYFPSKEAIAVELLRRYRETLLQLVEQRLDATSATHEATFDAVVHALVVALLRADGIDPALHRVLIEEVLRTAARAEMAGFEDRLQALLEGALRASEHAPHIRDFEIASFLLVRAVLAVVHAAVVDRPSLNSPRLADELARMIVRYLDDPVVQPKRATRPKRAPRTTRAARSLRAT